MKNRTAILLLLFATPLMMGNEGCEQRNEAPQGRRLKRQIDVSKISAPRINFPGAQGFDFEFVVNSQIYDAINKSDRFVVAFAADAPGAALSPADRQALSPPGARPLALGVNPFSASQDGPNQCVARVPILMVGGQVRSFEVVSGGGFWFGFRPGGSGNGAVNGSTAIDVQNAQMEIGLVGYHPLSRTVYGTGVATPSHTRVDINLSIDFGQFSLGPRFFFQSRLAGVTMRGLDVSLQRLANDLDAKATAERRPLWESRVVRDYDTHVTIRAGRRHGIRVGDEFEVYNLDHYWEDDSQPCRSRYLGAVRNSEQAVAILKATTERDLGDEFARLEVISADRDGTRRMPGAQVVIRQLVPDIAETSGRNEVGSSPPNSVR